MQRKFHSATFYVPASLPKSTLPSLFNYAYSFSYLAEVFAVLKMHVQMYQLNVKHKEKKIEDIKSKKCKMKT